MFSQLFSFLIEAFIFLIQHAFFKHEILIEQLTYVQPPSDFSNFFPQCYPLFIIDIEEFRQFAIFCDPLLITLITDNRGDYCREVNSLELA